jgi:hypothetical protein
MSKEKWSEEEVILSLKDMPNVTDKRSKEEIFQNIEHRLKRQKPRYRKKWLVSLATSAAAIAFLLFIPFEKNNITDPLLTIDDNGENYDKSSSTIIDGSDSRMGISSTGLNGTTINEDVVLSTRPFEEYHGVLLKYKPNKTIITIPVPDEQAQIVIPLTFIMESRELMNDADMYNAFNRKLATMPHNLSQFMFHNAKFSLGETGDILLIDVVENHQYDVGSASEMMFYETIEALLNYSFFEKVIFSTNGKPGITLNNVGTVYEMDRTDKNVGYYLHEHSNSNHLFLVPVSFGNISFEQMLQQMTITELGKPYTAIIPPGLISEVKEEGEIAVITLSDNFNLLEVENNIQVIDAILMTAKSYGYDYVKFASLTEGISSLGPYMLTEKIKVPLRPNGLIID